MVFLNFGSSWHRRLRDCFATCPSHNLSSFASSLGDPSSGHGSDGACCEPTVSQAALASARHPGPPALPAILPVKPAIAQLVEHLTVECCSNQMVPGSIPGGRIFCPNYDLIGLNFLCLAMVLPGHESFQSHCGGCCSLQHLGWKAPPIPLTGQRGGMCYLFGNHVFPCSIPWARGPSPCNHKPCAPMSQQPPFRKTMCSAPDAVRCFCQVNPVCASRWAQIKRL
jgi:hypothetical protein